VDTALVFEPPFRIVEVKQAPRKSLAKRWGLVSVTCTQNRTNKP
jgi:hypothetical protein